MPEVLRNVHIVLFYFDYYKKRILFLKVGIEKKQKKTNPFNMFYHFREYP